MTCLCSAKLKQLSAGLQATPEIAFEPPEGLAEMAAAAEATAALNGTAEASAAATAEGSMSAELGLAAAMASAIEGAFGAPMSVEMAADLAELVASLNANMPALEGIPPVDAGLMGLSQTASDIGAIEGALGVDVTAPGGLAEASGAIEAAAAATAEGTAEGTASAEMTGTAAGSADAAFAASLAGAMGIDMTGPNAAFELAQAAEIAAELSAAVPTLETPSVGLAAASGTLGAMANVQSELGVNLTAPTAGADLSAALGATLNAKIEVTAAMKAMAAMEASATAAAAVDLGAALDAAAGINAEGAMAIAAAASLAAQAEAALGISLTRPAGDCDSCPVKGIAGKL